MPVLLRGQLGRKGSAYGDLSPRLRCRALRMLGVDRQQGDVAVQVDPAFDVEAADLSNCEPVMLGQLAGWLTSGSAGTRLALHYRGGDYSGCCG